MTEITKYLFVILWNTSSARNDLKTILCEGKLRVEEGVIHFYSPYKVLHNEYSNSTGGKEMFGFGFQKDKVEKWIESKKLFAQPIPRIGSHCLSVTVNEICLDDFVDVKDERNVFFFLVVSIQPLFR